MEKRILSILFTLCLWPANWCCNPGGLLGYTLAEAWLGFFGGGAKPSSDPTGEQVGGLPPEDLYNF